MTGRALVAAGGVEVATPNRVEVEKRGREQ
jgi:hypothetical protein